MQSAECGLARGLRLALIVTTAASIHAGETDFLKPPAVDVPKLESPLQGITTTEGWTKRREELRVAWLDFMGQMPKEKPPLALEELSSEELPEFTRKKLKYQIEDGLFTEGYLLLPKNGRGPLPAIAVFHPTLKTTTARVAGFDASVPDAMHGVQFVKLGYAVFCSKCFIFDDKLDYVPAVKAMQAKHPTWTGMARMTWDCIRAVDVLEAQAIVDKNRIGAFGHSLGAKETLFATAFDERIKVGVFSEGGIGLSFSNWEAIWYLGDRIKAPAFKMDTHELLAIIAPRAFLVLAGESADNDKSWRYIAAAKPVYDLLQAPKSIGWLNHRKGHQYPSEAQAAAQEFMARFLKP